ncbi:hypothetical protein CPLU01_08649 [Colletotrichum plurivorum]|uniref:Zn(2)-C6 fungal-type domain-containing protein n=1 Tax=Colletotrichum plurivorum TaxID=2175906 RepID=A0A8H6ND39_9PEZI|nr:hypothetical protein CPLU01_08649 [Colletotrichum plurivorum]
MQDAFFASNSCRTCRQKRVKCDRRLPDCLRCCSLKLRCQGYERPKKLIWTNSVASRGKLMGKTTLDIAETPKPTLLTGAAWQPRKIDPSAGPLAETGPYPGRLPVSLTDTDLQDLTPECRKYIRYFVLDLSRESVVYDQPSNNPFLALVPLMSQSKALSHAMMSISAFHYTHRLVISNLQPHPGGDSVAAARSSEPWHLSNNHSWQMNQPNFRHSLRKALSHKQKALELLKSEVSDDPAKNSDATVAAVVLFICIDVVEFGSHGWDHHLRGAAAMVRSRRLSRDNEVSETAPWLKYFDTACTTFGILGATLAPTCDPLNPRSSSINPSFLEVLQHSENQTWVGCPAELLYLISAVNSLRVDPITIPEQESAVLNLCKRLHNFSPLAWAENFADQQYHESRSHLAHAYKAAVEVYAAHIVGPLLDHHYLSASHILEITRPAILHMLAISQEDFHIKSLVWPAFFLGAEAQNSELRDFIRNVFHRIWLSSCCYNAKNAVEVLDKIWAQDFDKSSGESWLNYVWKLEDSWLFV